MEKEISVLVSCITLQLNLPEDGDLTSKHVAGYNLISSYS